MGRTVLPGDHADNAPVVEATATHRFVTVAGRRLHTLDLGGRGRRPVLFLHGVGGSAWMWLAVCRALGDGVGPKLALDFRGYGESQWSSDLAYTTEDHVADVEALVGALGLEELDVVGFSWGGLVGLALAARSDRVRRLALVDVPPSFDQSETDIPPLAYEFPGLDDAVAAERRLAPRADEAELVTAATLAVRPAEGGHLVKKHDPYFLLRWPFRGDDRWAELRSLRRPLLVVHAAESIVLSTASAVRMVAEAPDARLVEIAESGHMVATEQPAALAAALREFLA